MFIALLLSLELTFSKALELAVSNSAVLKSKELEVKIYEYRVKESASLFYPKLGLETAVYRSNNPVLLPQEFLTVSLPADSYSYLTRIVLKQNLYTGSMKDIYRASKLEYEKAKLEYESVKQEVLKNAAIAYNNFLYWKARNTHTRDEYTAFNLETSKIELIQALGLEHFQDFSIADDFKPLEFDEKLDVLLIKASNKPELKQKIFEEELSETALKMALNVSNPRVAVVAGTQKFASEYTFTNPDVFFMLGVSLPIFDGFQTISRLRQDDLKLKKAGYEKLRIANKIDADVRKQYLAFLYYKKLLETASQLDKSYNDIVRDFNAAVINLKYTCGILP